MKNYFYTCNAQEEKIYVFWNSSWLNQLIKIDGQFYWVSLNECGTNWCSSGSPKQTIQAAIEDVLRRGCYADVYQLDTLKELAEFILEEK